MLNALSLPTAGLVVYAYPQSASNSSITTRFPLSFVHVKKPDGSDLCPNLDTNFITSHLNEQYIDIAQSNTTLSPYLYVIPFSNDMGGVLTQGVYRGSEVLGGQSRLEVQAASTLPASFIGVTSWEYAVLNIHGRNLELTQPSR